MNQKEKLIEIINNVIRCDKCGIVPERMAEDLIFYDVTVQEWISVDDRLPERTLPPKDVLVYHDLECGMFVDRAWYSYDKKDGVQCWE